MSRRSSSPSQGSFPQGFLESRCGSPKARFRHPPTEAAGSRVRGRWPASPGRLVYVSVPRGRQATLRPARKMCASLLPSAIYSLVLPAVFNEGPTHHVGHTHGLAFLRRKLISVLLEPLVIFRFDVHGDRNKL